MVDEKKEQECKAKFEDCLTEDTVDSLHTGRHLALIWAVIFAICGIFVWLGPIFFPTDESVLMRSLTLRIPPDLINAGILMSVLWLFDVLSPSTSIKNSTSEPLPAAITLGALMLSLALLMMSY